MSRGATQELGGQHTPRVMENVYTTARSEEVAPEMDAAMNKACTLLGAGAFVLGLDDDSCIDGGEAVGSHGGQSFVSGSTVSAR